jgi:hypothetical protein
MCLNAPTQMVHYPSRHVPPSIQPNCNIAHILPFESAVNQVFFGFLLHANVKNGL